MHKKDVHCECMGCRMTRAENKLASLEEMMQLLLTSDSPDEQGSPELGKAIRSSLKIRLRETATQALPHHHKQDSPYGVRTEYVKGQAPGHKSACKCLKCRLGRIEAAMEELERSLDGPVREKRDWSPEVSGLLRNP